MHRFWLTCIDSQPSDLNFIENKLHEWCDEYPSKIVKKYSHTNGVVVFLIDIDVEIDATTCNINTIKIIEHSICLESGWILQNGIRANNRTIFNEKYNINNIENGEFSRVEVSKCCVKFLSDKYGCQRIYFNTHKSPWIFSNDIRLLIFCLKDSITVRRHRCMLNLCHTVSILDQLEMASERKTFFNEIEQLSPSCELKIDVKFPLQRDELALYNSIKFNDEKNFFDVFIDAVNLRAQEPFILSLSGGLDSSAVAGAISYKGLQGNGIALNMSFTDPELSNSQDSKIAENIMKYIGMRGGIVYMDDLLNYESIYPTGQPIETINGPDNTAFPQWKSESSAISLQYKINRNITGENGDYILGEFSPLLYSDALRNEGKHRSALDMIKRIFIENGASNAITKSYIFYIILFIPKLRDKLYFNLEWKELFDIEWPSFFSNEMISFEKKQRNFNAKVLKNANENLNFVKRMRWNSMYPKAELYENLQGNSVFAHPFFDTALISYIENIEQSALFDYQSFDGTNTYSCSKKMVRDNFRNLLPKSAIEKKEKTSYSDMARKRIVNSSSFILDTFCTRQSTLSSQMGLIDQKVMTDHIVSMILKCKEKNYILPSTYQYLNNVITLELWLLLVSNRENFLKSIKLKTATARATVEWIN